MDLPVSNPYFFSVVLVLIGLFLGLVIRGWFSSKISVSKPDIKKGQESTAFLKGINYLLSNNHDQAIEEFTKAVQINSDTIETYMALGNLFRTKGEVGRAIRIHESIILRPSIDRETRVQAMYDLSLDFKKAGFIKRAISSFEEVIENEPSRLDAHIQLEELYEETKDWEKAFRIQQRVSVLRKTNDDNILAHLQTEMGKIFFKNNDINSAKKSFKRAILLDSHCIDALIHLGDLHFSQKAYARAISAWKNVIKINPAFTHLVSDRLENAYSEKKKSHGFENFLRKRCSEDRSNPNIHLALAMYLHKRGEVQDAVRELRSVIEIDPTSLDARKELGKILVGRGLNDELVTEYQDLLKILDLPEKKLRCQNCGFESEEIKWKCPQCLKWDTIIHKESEGKDQ